MKRQCGTCTLCCRLLPVKELAKQANERCQHQRHTGCTIYKDRPMSCRAWSCAWLLGLANTKRPDHAHYVVDTMPDFVVTEDNDVQTKAPVIQVWCDPKHPLAYRDPDLLALLEQRRMPALIRFSGSGRAIFLVPGTLSSTGMPFEKASQESSAEHSMAEIFNVFTGRDT